MARLRAEVGPGASEEALWTALAGLLARLGDSHTKLVRANEDGPRRTRHGLGRTLPRIEATLGGGAWLGALIGQLQDRLDPEPRGTLGGGRLVWGVLDGRVGYLQLFVMGGFTGEAGFGTAAWAKRERAVFAEALDAAFAAFAGLDAVIVDLSNNRGGYDAIARDLAGRFTEAPFVAWRTEVRGAGQPPAPRVVPPADGPRFGGRVLLLTSDVTVSGGELATLALRQLPQVLHAGTRTRGAFSTPSPWPLPNGWWLELANETFSDPDGRVFEGVGLTPEITLEPFPRDAPVKGHRRALERLLARVSRGERAPPSEAL